MILKRRITEAEVIAEFLKNEFYQKEYDRDRDQYERHRRIHGRICRADVEEQALYGTAEERGANQPEPDADASFP